MDNEDEERWMHAHNRREVRHFLTAWAIYAAVAAGSAIGATLTHGAAQIKLIVVAVIFTGVALWVGLFAFGGLFLVLWTQRTRR